MKKKHEIKTISDIKYCEKHRLTIFSEIEDEYYEFQNNCWCKYDDDSGKLLYYGCGINTASLEGFLYYYEEKSEEPVQEATEDDLGCLCYCWNEENDKEELGVLEGYDISDDDDKYHITGLGWFQHCRRLSPSEVAEITGYKVEKAE